MRRWLMVPVLVGLVPTLLLFDPNVSMARPEYSRRTKKECGYCHPRDSWDVNDAGKYFRDHNHSLEGYKPKEGDGK
jgi:hypothetical protein